MWFWLWKDNSCSGIAKDEGASDALIAINDLKDVLALLAVKVRLDQLHPRHVVVLHKKRK